MLTSLHFPVKQARKIKKLKIVSFDWLEDSLMNHSPKREGGYLMKGRVKAAAKAKAKKTATRRQNMKQGGKCRVRAKMSYRSI